MYFLFRSAIEKELIDFDDEDGIEDNLWENASPGEVHERIRHHLIQQKFGPAISLLNEAKKEFPVFKNLENDDENIAGQLRTIFFMPLFREVAEKDEQEKQETVEEVNQDVQMQTKMVNYLKVRSEHRG